MRKTVTALLVLAQFGCSVDRSESLTDGSEVAGEVDPLAHVFTYSILETDASAALTSVEAVAIPGLLEAGATLYSIWSPVGIPDSAPFAGLRETELALMMAWPEQDARASTIDSTLNVIEGISSVWSRTFVPIYLAEGLTVPTGPGFYVHREEKYQVGDVAEAVRLSQEAWETWEPFWSTRVTGLFRQSPDSGGVANLLRIVWYPSLDGWTETREFSREPESMRRFRARAQLQLQGSGVAIATNRAPR